MPKPLSVLIVEDSEDDAMLLLRELQKGGYEVAWERVCSAEALKATLAARKWDIIISDYVMPGFSGISALRMVKESGIDVPFIIVSGKMGEENAVELMRAGAHDYIVKAKMDRLIPAVERELQETDNRRQAKKALYRSEEKFRSIYDNAPIGIFQSTLEGRFISANPAVAGLYAYDSPEQMLAEVTDISAQIFVHAEQRGEIVRKALESDRFVREEVMYRRRDGSQFIANLYIRAVRAGSEVAFLEGFVEDITERKRAEEAFHTQFRQISTIFDELSVIAYVNDPATGELLYLNKYGTAIFGDQWQGKRYHEVIHCDHSDPCLLAVPGQGGEGGEAGTQHIFEYRNTLTGRWYQCVEKVISWVDGRLVRITVAVDITDLKDMMQMQEELLSAVSHEMRTPLTAICGYTEFLLENSVDEAQLHEYLGIIQRENERLNELLDNFLNLQRLKTKPPMDGMSPLDLMPLLAEAAAHFTVRSAKHMIIASASPDLPPVLIRAEHLRELLANLLSNAVKYSPDGGEIIIGAQQEADETVSLWVRDNGIGIPPDVLNKIFDKFYQVDSGDRRAFSCTGLGLALVEEIVNVYGGKVRVESTLGKGSTFFDALPVGTRPNDSPVVQFPA